MTALLEVRDLRVHFTVGGGLFRPPRGVVRAVDGVSFELQRREVLALVGESGCGKTTIARSILGLAPITDGQIALDGAALDLSGAERTPDFRRRVQMVFQDPYDSLNPRRSILQTLSLPLKVLGMRDRAALRAECARLLDQVGLSPGAEFLDRYPHQFSGGQRQRIGIARALAVKPELIVADEAVSALDISIRAQVLALMRRLQQELSLAYLFITHDLGVVRSLADRVMVMYLGRVVEEGPTDAVFALPRHPYTRALLAASPLPDPRKARARTAEVVAGEIPSPLNPPSGCHFHPRCPVAIDRCRSVAPALEAHGPTRAACHRAGEAEALIHAARTG